MARRIALPAVDLGLAGSRPSSFETAVLVLGTGGRPHRDCTITDHLAALARQAELDAQAQAEILGAVITSVFDDLELSSAARAHANERLGAELTKAAAGWDAREPRWPD